MENIFKFKRATKSIGDFDANDPNEWMLLVKPQIGAATLFVHIHKLWLVQEQPKIEPDPDNGIEGQEAIEAVPAFEIFFGFLKDDSFVIERQKSVKRRVNIEIEQVATETLKTYVDDGYTKDWVRYNADNTVNPPDYYEYPRQDSNSRKSAMLSSFQQGLIKSGVIQTQKLGSSNNVQQIFSGIDSLALNVTNTGAMNIQPSNSGSGVNLFKRKSNP